MSAVRIPSHAVFYDSEVKDRWATAHSDGSKEEQNPGGVVGKLLQGGEEQSECKAYPPRS